MPATGLEAGQVLQFLQNPKYSGPIEQIISTHIFCVMDWLRYCDFRVGENYPLHFVALKYNRIIPIIIFLIGYEINIIAFLDIDAASRNI